MFPSRPPQFKVAPLEGSKREGGSPKKCRRADGALTPPLLKEELQQFNVFLDNDLDDRWAVLGCVANWEILRSVYTERKTAPLATERKTAQLAT